MFSEKLYATLPPGADRPLSPGGRLVCWAGVLLAALIYALFSLHVPYIGDDYALPVDWMTANGGVKEFSWPRMWNFTAYLRSIDNCRLDNIVFMAMRMALLPKWTLALVVGLSGAFLILGAGQLCSPRRSDLPLVMIAFWGWMTFTFSWPFGTMGIDNSFNVLLPSAMTVWFLVLLRRVASGRLPVPVLVAGGVYAFLCGWIHEGYAVPVGCGLGTWALLRRFRMPWQWWILTAVFAAGALWVVSAPGLWMRFSSVSVGAPVNLKTVLTLSLPVVVLAGLAVVLMACRIRKCALGGCRDHYWHPQAMDVVVAMAFVVSAVIVFKSSPSNPRALWICNLFASLTMFGLLRTVFVRWPATVLKCLAGVALLMIVVFYINVIRTQKRLWDEEQEIERQMAESETGTVYRDYTIAMSKLTLLHPVNAHWRTTLHINSYNDFYPGDKVFAVVPPVLESLTAEMVDWMERCSNGGHDSHERPGFPAKLSGGADVFAYGDELIMPDRRMTMTYWTGTETEVASRGIKCDYECADGRRFDSMESVQIRFRTRDGRSLIYIAPCHVKVTGPYNSVSYVETPSN